MEDSPCYVVLGRLTLFTQDPSLLQSSYSKGREVIKLSMDNGDFDKVQNILQVKFIENGDDKQVLIPVSNVKSIVNYIPIISAITGFLALSLLFLLLLSKRRYRETKKYISKDNSTHSDNVFYGRDSERLGIDPDIGHTETKPVDYQLLTVVSGARDSPISIRSMIHDVSGELLGSNCSDEEEAISVSEGSASFSYSWEFQTSDMICQAKSDIEQDANRAIGRTSPLSFSDNEDVNFVPSAYTEINYVSEEISSTIVNGRVSERLGINPAKNYQRCRAMDDSMLRQTSEEVIIHESMIHDRSNNTENLMSGHNSERLGIDPVKSREEVLIDQSVILDRSNNTENLMSGYNCERLGIDPVESRTHCIASENVITKLASNYIEGTMIGAWSSHNDDAKESEHILNEPESDRLGIYPNPRYKMDSSSGDNIVVDCNTDPLIIKHECNRNILKETYKLSPSASGDTVVEINPNLGRCSERAVIVQNESTEARNLLRCRESAIKNKFPVDNIILGQCVPQSTSNICHNQPFLLEEMNASKGDLSNSSNICYRRNSIFLVIDPKERSHYNQGAATNEHETSIDLDGDINKNSYSFKKDIKIVEFMESENMPDIKDLDIVRMRPIEIYQQQPGSQLFSHTSEGSHLSVRVEDTYIDNYLSSVENNLNSNNQRINLRENYHGEYYGEINPLEDDKIVSLVADPLHAPPKMDSVEKVTFYEKSAFESGESMENGYTSQVEIEQHFLNNNDNVLNEDIDALQNDCMTPCKEYSKPTIEQYKKLPTMRSELMKVESDLPICSICYKEALTGVTFCSCGNPECNKVVHTACWFGFKTPLPSTSYPCTPPSTLFVCALTRKSRDNGLECAKSPLTDQESSSESEKTLQRLHEINAFIERGDWHGFMKNLKSKYVNDQLHLLSDDVRRRIYDIEALVQREDWDGLVKCAVRDGN